LQFVAQALVASIVVAMARYRCDGDRDEVGDSTAFFQDAISETNDA
jgi:hypothetical protein